MATDSPFSRHYRQVFQGPPVHSKPQSPSPSRNSPFRPNQSDPRRDINIFQAAFENEKPRTSSKSEPKIKIFGMGDKKLKKDDFKVVSTTSANQAHKNKAQASRNLLESLESLPDDYCCKAQTEPEDPKRFDELQRLLELTPGVASTSELRTESRIEEKGDTVQGIRNEGHAGRGPESRLLGEPGGHVDRQSQVVWLQTDSCEIQKSRSNNPHSQNNDSFSCKSINSSKVRDIFDHCSELLSNEEARRGNTSSRNQGSLVQQSKIICSNLKPQSGLKSPLFPPRGQHSCHPLTLDCSPNNQQGITLHKKTIGYQQHKTGQCPEPSTKQSEREGKDAKKGIELKRYLSLDNHYFNEVDMMINRYQKMAQIKQKKKAIKEELVKLTPKSTLRPRNEPNDFRTPPHFLASDYCDPTVSPKGSALLASTPLTHRLLLASQNKSAREGRVREDPSELQKQLNSNVRNMERIINKFKLLSKQISNESQQLVNSQFLFESTSNCLEKDPAPRLQNRVFFPKQQQLSDGQLRMQFYQSSQLTRRNRSAQAQDNIKAVGSMMDSIQQISLSKQLANIEQRENPYSISRANHQTKHSARTEKKGGSGSNYKSSFGFSTQMFPNKESNHRRCECDHTYLAQELSKIHRKLEKLQKDSGPQLHQIKSQETLKNRIAVVPEYQLRFERKSVDSADSLDQRQLVPPQKKVQFKASEGQPIAQKPQRGIVQAKGRDNAPVNKMAKSQRQYLGQERISHEIDDEVLKKMRINFPIFEGVPSKNDSLADLVTLGEYVFSILLKFLASRPFAFLQRANIAGNLRVKKHLDYIHYILPGFDLHLVYSFSGKIYFGEWSQEVAGGGGYKQGFGYYAKPNKYVYEGEFYLNRKHGKGLLNTAKGEVYEGDWVKGKRQGYGIFVNAAGDIYRGFFQANKRHGKGEEQLTNGDYYRGEFRKGKLSGEGVYVWADGSTYQGGFKNGQLDGRGKWISRDNDIYQGEYKGNKKHGEGTYTWSNGACFSGYFKDDQSTGQRRQGRSAKDKASQQALRRKSAEGKVKRGRIEG